LFSHTLDDILIILKEAECGALEFLAHYETEPTESCCVAVTLEFVWEYGDFAYPKFSMYCVAPRQFPDWQEARPWDITAKRILGCFHMLMQIGKQIPFTIINTPHIVLNNVELVSPAASIGILSARTTMTKQNTKAVV
jgi:aspartate/glutamate racemase